MGAIYVKVLMQERRVKKYQHYNTQINVEETTDSAATTASKKKKEKEKNKASASKRIAHQAIFYSGSFFITWLFPTWARIYEMVNPGKETPFVIIILFTILTPLQGLFNVFVYFRPKYLHYKHQHPDFNICQFFYQRGTMRKSSLVNTSRSNTNPADINESERSYMRRFFMSTTKRLFNPRRSVNTNKTSFKSATNIESATINNQTITLEKEDHHVHHDRKSKVSFADDVNNIEEEKVEETTDAVP